MYAADMREFLNRFQADCHDDGGAVRVGDDAFAALLESLCDVIGVEFRNHQRHILIHAERRRVVNHDGTMTGDVLGVFL